MGRKYKEFVRHVLSVPRVSTVQLIDKNDIAGDFDREHSWGKMLYTLPDKNNHRETALELINIAEERQLPLFIASFIINYDDVVDRIIAASDKLKGKVFIITALNKNEVRKVISKQEDEEEHFSALEKLSKAGVRIRNYSDGHWKLLLAGTDIGFITSANLTEEAYTSNPELGVLMTNHHYLKELKSLFKEIWLHYTTEELLIRDTAKLEPDTNLQTVNTDIPKHPHHELQLFSTLGHDEVKTFIFDLLNNATKSIDILCYTITNNEIIDLLNDKADEGVVVRLLLPVISSRRRWVRDKLSLLNDSIKTRYFQENHSKAIIIDGKQVFITTGNLDKFLDEKTSLDLAVHSMSGECVSKTLEYFNLVYDHGSEMKKADFSVIWEENRVVNILIDSPGRLSPRMNVDLNRILANFDGSEVLSYEFESNRKKYLVIQTRKGEEDRILPLMEIPKGYRVELIPFVRSQMRTVVPTCYRELELRFKWLDHETTEELLP
ncbi:MAG: phospholipase D-like domain-containing protein [Candidatus Odinarchaeota archaeon]